MIDFISLLKYLVALFIGLNLLLYASSHYAIRTAYLIGSAYGLW